MLKQLEGSQGVAQAVALCRPNIVCAYPISPQTHIVEALGRLVRAGKIEDCEYLNVESEFGAMSVAIGASAAGAFSAAAAADFTPTIPPVWKPSEIADLAEEPATINSVTLERTV